jgi:hypothetical protein
MKPLRWECALFSMISAAYPVQLFNNIDPSSRIELERVD